MAGLAPERVFVALDVEMPADALDWVRRLRPAGVRFKVGLQLFCRHGPDGVRRVQEAAGPVLLDLKLHDIPNTVMGAAAALGELGVWGVTLHASGGPVMLRAAVDAAAAAPHPFLCLGVTVLTSLDEQILHALGVRMPMAQQVVALAEMAMAAGCGGVVASPHEVRAVRRATGPDCRIVTPGVRPGWAARGDQARAATPAEVARAGSDYLVVGRAVTAAHDPEAALDAILHDIAG